MPGGGGQIKTHVRSAALGYLLCELEAGVADRCPGLERCGAVTVCSHGRAIVVASYERVEKRGVELLGTGPEVWKLRAGEGGQRKADRTG